MDCDATPPQKKIGPAQMVCLECRTNDESAVMQSHDDSAYVRTPTLSLKQTSASEARRGWPSASEGVSPLNNNLRQNSSPMRGRQEQPDIIGLCDF